MSCIATLRHENVIYMACDSAWSFYPGGEVSIGVEPKKIITLPVENSQNQVLIGVTGPGSILCLLYQELDGQVLTELTATFSHIQALIDSVLQKDASLWNIFDSSVDPCNILVAIDSKLYRITGKYIWVEIDATSYAIGSGADLAIGALSILNAFQPITKVLELTGEAMVQTWLTLAMEITEANDSTVRKPFHLFSTVQLSDEEK